jgi:hypothetical protein
MAFHSLLFRRPEDPIDGESEAPGFFHDLNLDQVVATVTAGREEYRLAPFFHAPLGDLDSIAWRQEVMQALEERVTREAIQSFSGGMRATRQRLVEAGKRYDALQRQRWFLAAGGIYCGAVEGLHRALGPLDLRSRALLAFREHLAEYAGSAAFARLAAETRRVEAALATVRYRLHIWGNVITVHHDQGEADYGEEVARTFERFRRGAARDYRTRFPDSSDLNHVEAQILSRVAMLNPAPFGDLAAYCAEHVAFQEPGVVRFDREVQFYLAWLEQVERLRRAGLDFCYPRLSDSSKEVVARDTFDVALADKLGIDGAPVVRNDLLLRGPERIMVVSGPNQGGKTTLARTFGQLHYLARLGCPVPGTQARLFLCDRIFSHFERQEDAATLRGKLRDDLVRIRGILDQATPRSIVILNEVFASTTLDDAVFLSRRIMERLSRLDLLAVCVTFVVELASFDEKTVSVVGAVDPADPTRRTFKLVRRPADGLAYALAIAEKYRVTSRWLEERLRS